MNERFVTRRFINLVNKIRENLRVASVKLDNALSKQTEAIKKAANAQDEQAKTNQLVLFELHEHESDARYNQERKRKPDPMQWTKLAVELGTLIVVATYTYLSALQLGEMKITADQSVIAANASKMANDIANESLEGVQRAYLTVRASPEFTLANSDKPFFRIEMPIENAGNTPAQGLKDRISCAAPQGEIPSGYTFPDIEKGSCGNPWAATGAGTIGPKGSVNSQQVTVDLSTIKEFMSQNQGDKFGHANTHARQIYTWGWVTYRDVFYPRTPIRLTEFCRRLRYISFERGGVEYEWTFCPTHNCTDEYCPDYKEQIKAADAAPTCCKPSKK